MIYCPQCATAVEDGFKSKLWCGYCGWTNDYPVFPTASCNDCYILDNRVGLVHMQWVGLATKNAFKELHLGLKFGFVQMYFGQS